MTLKITIVDRSMDELIDLLADAYEEKEGKTNDT